MTLLASHQALSGMNSGPDQMKLRQCYKCTLDSSQPLVRPQHVQHGQRSRPRGPNAAGGGSGTSADPTCQQESGAGGPSDVHTGLVGALSVGTYARIPGASRVPTLKSTHGCNAETRWPSAFPQPTDMLVASARAACLLSSGAVITAITGLSYNY